MKKMFLCLVMVFGVLFFNEYNAGVAYAAYWCDEHHIHHETGRASTYWCDRHATHHTSDDCKQYYNIKT